MSPSQREVAVEGPPSFESAVKQLFGELQCCAPEGYHDAVRLMPRLTYAPGCLESSHVFAVLATADGAFAIDGSDYELFRWVFLHELGHNVAIEKGLGSGELAANRYADKMVRALLT